MLREGELPLDPVQARHARAVLRLADGAEVEVFDDAGRTAAGVLVYQGSHGAAVRVEQMRDEGAAIGGGASAATGARWSVAAAVPKGERADWMVEKLSELGAEAFVPLATARAVVLPEGRGKLDRWARIATESAKQSRRRGVMRIEPLTPLARAVEAVMSAGGGGWCLSTRQDAVPVWRAAAEWLKESRDSSRSLTLFVGPEGGWTTEELGVMTAAGFFAIRLTGAVLRVETAAVAAGSVVAVATFSLGAPVMTDGGSPASPTSASSDTGELSRAVEPRDGG